MNTLKIVEAFFGEQKSTNCATENCNRMINYGDQYFIDLINFHNYCHQCGICVRYSRQKSIQRGQKLE